MRAAMDDAARRAGGHEAVLVSHQLPIWVVRRSVAGQPLWHHPGRRQCALASLTTFTYTDGTITAVSYAEPAGESPSQAHGA
jgi:broad specificity phosphatase PhoE